MSHIGSDSDLLKLKGSLEDSKSRAGMQSKSGLEGLSGPQTLRIPNFGEKKSRQNPQLYKSANNEVFRSFKRNMFIRDEFDTNPIMS